MTTLITSPESLVAIAVAARKANDRSLEDRAKRALKKKFDITISFPRKKKESS